MLTAEFFTKNRTRLRAVLPDDALVIICAQSLLQRSADTTYRFRQDSNFYYLTGITEPDIVLVMAGEHEFLILPKRTPAEVLFGGEINCDEIAKTSGVMTIYSHQEGWSKYKELQKRRKKVHTLGAAPVKVIQADSFYTNPARRQILQKLKRISSVEFVDIRPQLMNMRMLKQSAELAALQRAIDITQLGFKAAHKLCADGAAEYEIEAAFDNIFKRQQSVHGYEPIIASGSNAVKLHYNRNNRSPKEGDLILIDVGAEYSGYSADITRTYCFGQMSDRQRAVYDAVARVQSAALQVLKPGIQWRAYAEEVDALMGEELIGLGLIKSNTRSEVRRYFGHGISHSLGLDVHDVCDYDVLSEGMVITVEPGIYIPEEGIGVRIEDDVHIALQGLEVMSSNIR